MSNISTDNQFLALANTQNPEDGAERSGNTENHLCIHSILSLDRQIHFFNLTKYVGSNRNPIFHSQLGFDIHSPINRNSCNLKTLDSMHEEAYIPLHRRTPIKKDASKVKSEEEVVIISNKDSEECW